MKNRTQKFVLLLSVYLLVFGFVSIELDQLKLCDKPIVFHLLIDYDCYSIFWVEWDEKKEQMNIQGIIVIL